MARPLRIEFPGALYHITARGNARRAVFLNDDDRALFLGLLGLEIGQQRWICHAYCLMNTHYHLLIETPEPNLVRGMARLNGVYTQAFNRRHQRAGHLFRGRYQSIIVDKNGYLLELARYLVLNPVRAKLVTSPARWAWSSYRATAGAVAAPPWLTTDWVLKQFGASKALARRAYREFVAQGAGRKPWDSLRAQIWLGDEAFLKRMQKLAAGAPRGGIPRAQARAARPSPEAVIAAVSRSYRVSRRLVLDRSHPEALRAAAYLLRRAANLPLNEVAGRVGVSAARISQIQSAIERGKPGAVLNRLINRYKVKA